MANFVFFLSGMTAIYMGVALWISSGLRYRDGNGVCKVLSLSDFHAGAQFLPASRIPFLMAFKRSMHLSRWTIFSFLPPS
jgi:hypothetical protein